MEIGRANCSCVCWRMLCFYWRINGVVETLPILGSDNWNYKECCTRTITFCEKIGTRYLILNLEDKVLSEDEVIVMNPSVDLEDQASHNTVNGGHGPEMAYSL
ncbi:hypothetical protein KY290_034586 [Solanum tuberosum]|uniref:Uncharacterized protein n=1 Tax=Solanum tuberosum TaxID=4113 RepID=A0ABQ7U5F2_SOLTU|nr:hypothetical protein KY284_033668 [Solanum tuberosum]KAH0741543.1 hypothetical protein KY290_034586 [Solanum tuberosum]